ncbi:unnamed protein product [Lota lota]
MEDRFSRRKDRLGLSFSIDYLLYNKGAQSSREEQLEIPQQTVNTHVLDHRNQQSEEVGVNPDKMEKGPQESDEKNGQMKVKEDQGDVDQGHEGEEVNTTSICSILEKSEDKPTQSYVALISMAILASEEEKLLLCDIYQWIMAHYPYLRSKSFIQAGHCDNSKGHFWAVHRTKYQDFSKEDYHRRRTWCRVRRVRGQLPHISLNSLVSTFCSPSPMETGALPYWCHPPSHCPACLEGSTGGGQGRPSHFTITVVDSPRVCEGCGVASVNRRGAVECER